MRISIIALLLSCLASLSAQASAPETSAIPKYFTTAFVRFFMPDEVVAKRTNAESLSITITRIQDLAAFWSTLPAASSGADSCIIHVAIRPGALMKTWTVCEAIDGSTLDRIITDQLLPEEIARVSEGMVIFSLNGETGWASQTTSAQMPKAWRDAGAGESMPMEALVAKAWPL